MSLSHRLGTFVADLRFSDLPKSVIERTKSLLLHNVANALVGFQYPVARRVIAFVRAEETPRTGGSRVLVEGAQVTKMGAAYANSVLMHVTGQSDSYRVFTHPGLTVIPAALAMADEALVSGRDLLTALASGYEVLARVARDALPSTQANGFRSGALYGGVGAAIAAAKVISLDADGISNAIAHWVSVAAGNLEGARSGGHETVLHEPTAARNGVLAALQARDGFRGGASVLEGAAGFYRAYAGIVNGRPTHDFGGQPEIDLALVAADLGNRWETLDVIQKAYSTSGYNQPLVELAARLAGEHDVQAGEIEAIEIEMNWLETLYPSPAFTRVPPAPRRKSSHYFCAWGLLTRGYPRLGRPIGHMVGMDELDQAEAAGVLELMGRITLIPSTERPVMSPRITVRTSRGAFVTEGTGDEFKWSYATTRRRAAELIPGMEITEDSFNRLADWIESIEDAPTLSPLFALTSRVGGDDE